MDVDDTVPLVIAAIVTSLMWAPWYGAVFKTFAPNTSLRPRIALACLPILAAVSVYVALATIAERKVAESVGYRALFTATAAISLRVLFAALAALGVDAIRDGIESTNPAGLIVAFGATAGAVALNLGANVGTGDTIASTILPVAFGTVELSAFVAILAAITPLADDASSGRNLCSACRLAGCIFAASLPLAHGAMGDWASALATFSDMVLAAWPLAIVALAAATIERMWPSTPNSGPRGWLAGTAPSLGLIAIALTATWCRTFAL